VDAGRGLRRAARRSIDAWLLVIDNGEAATVPAIDSVRLVPGRPRPCSNRPGRSLVMTAPAAVTPDLLNAAAPAVDCAHVGFGHRGERPYSKQLLVRTSDGVSLAVCDTGPRTAEHTVVFLHGLCLNETSWERQITYLRRRYGRCVRVITYDHRGHGRSATAPMNTYRIDQVADDLAQVLTALDVTGPLTLVGHSMGGMTALAYLARSTSKRPIEPDGLILIATAAGELAERGFARLLATPAPAALIGLIEHTPQYALNALTGPVCATLGRWRGHGRSTTLAATLAAALATTPVATAVGFLPSLRDYNQYATLRSIRARTVVISGGADPLTPPSHAADMSAGICGAEHIHVPYAGHMLPQQAPQVINDAIRRTIARPGSADAVSPCRPRRGGMTAMGHAWALSPKKPNNCSRHLLDDRSGVRRVAGSMTNPV
jgi:pimeloyl-ACP methyl ester carboxylesterase